VEDLRASSLQKVEISLVPFWTTGAQYSQKDIGTER
jgi:hypothetical protein